MVLKNLTFVPKNQPNLNIPYILTLPSDYDAEKDNLPLILNLHGAGERGSDLSRIPLTGLAQLFVNDPDYKGLRVITVSPQCSEDLYWNDYVFGLMDLVEYIADHYAVDRGHISCTGLSMGGFGTWAMIQTFPKFFSAASPICGGGISWLCDRISTVPIRIYHSDRDPAVPCAYSRLMYDTLKALGGRVEMTIYDSDSHNCWDRSYRDTDLIEWLMTAK